MSTTEPEPTEATPETDPDDEHHVHPGTTPNQMPEPLDYGDQTENGEPDEGEQDDGA